VVEIFIANRWLEQVAVVCYPLGEVERSSYHDDDLSER
jgi:hypothetical protein